MQYANEGDAYSISTFEKQRDAVLFLHIPLMYTAGTVWIYTVSQKKTTNIISHITFN